MTELSEAIERLTRHRKASESIETCKDSPHWIGEPVDVWDTCWNELSLSDDKEKLVNEYLDLHDAARLILEAELKELQHVCPHENVNKWKKYDSNGECNYYWECKDCGKRKAT